MGHQSSHHNLLHFHILTIDEANHVNAIRCIDGLADAAVDALAAEDASCDVDDLQGG